jgi:rare lipoprotein A (peptidoglycan hydrolase)
MLLLTFLLLISGNALSSDNTHRHHTTHSVKHSAPIKKKVAVPNKKKIAKAKSFKHFRQIGIASWYGYQHAGRRTKSGEVFHPLWASAAHNVLPMGTKVRVTNLANKKTIILRINDTGGFKKYNRIIDLSLGAARVLGISGIEKVMVEVI